MITIVEFLNAQQSLAASGLEFKTAQCVEKATGEITLIIYAQIISNDSVRQTRVANKGFYPFQLATQRMETRW